MGDHKKKALEPKLKLEELYEGIPDESVNLTFQDLPNVMKNTTIYEGNAINTPTKNISSPSLSPMSMSPIHDFQKGLKVYSNDIYNQQDFGHRGVDGVGVQSTPSRASEYSMGYDAMSGESLGSGKAGVGRRRRQGIPHSKICTICNDYVYFFRTRCLVCGRVYCKQCMEVGMGELREGRKCIDCLGLRFSQRYIERAGLLGCLNWRYPSTLKQNELKWAEKGPRRNGDKGYGHHSRTTTPTTPRSPLSIASSEASYAMSATYSPFTPHHHHHPL
ncbi:unnamed protein product [Trifolium pratense]|uniref:Uncharacterized protein n=1 Tax=Trifolium pratense TaxID=57577 RepID=A0ACB0JA05_TRIPR|nr:unnamed protein product [Trifolium pratense]